MSPAQGHTRRAVLIHWNAEDGKALLPLLQRAGWEAQCLTPQAGTGLAGLRSDPPQAIIIDLSRLPSHGRDVGIALRRYKTTRHVPLLFAGGDAGKVAAIRSVMPDAIYAEWLAIQEALAIALRDAPDQPVVPAALEGYSGTPLPKKLGIKPGSTLSVIRGPQGFLAKLRVPPGVTVHERTASADRVLLFVRSAKDLQQLFDAASKAVKEGGALWLIWPKKASGIETDVNEPRVRQFGLERGWVDYKICAVDETWSGLQFARRRA